MRPSLGSGGDVVRHVHDLARDGHRVLLGITGAPGAGKTTFADRLAALLRASAPGGLHDDWVVRLPMDGFHLADCQLARLDRLARKGAPDTFDTAGYVALLERLVLDRDETIYAPAFERDLEQPVAGSICVSPSTRVLITEGNYLLLADGGWERVREVLDEVWYLELDDAERRRRLVARHERFGKSKAEARDWVNGTDERNAEMVAHTSARADLHVVSTVLDASGVVQPATPRLS
ncbi:nucleoside/nucleotide kinase family protein [uncultured Friedmanniella sp.]|uniref:nucleoside/nucleotide kinase family protein n=1 Tax=uncultured Friedmanniella sp. TaxID=335381 RepID=UPI0035CA9791